MFIADLPELLCHQLTLHFCLLQHLLGCSQGILELRGGGHAPINILVVWQMLAVCQELRVVIVVHLMRLLLVLVEQRTSQLGICYVEIQA